MANQERTSGAESIGITEERRLLGLEAVWEIEALNATIRDLCESLGCGEDDQADLMRLRLKIRGITSRIGQLGGVAMSILDDDDDTSALARKVFGTSNEKEAAHV